MIISNPEQLNNFPIPEKINKGEQTTFYIYFLWWDEEIVYIGQTVNLTSRILSHVNSKCFNKVTYTLYENIKKTKILEIERANINHYKPIFNDDGKAIFKKPDFCYLRKGETGITLKKLELVKIINIYYFYDGDILHTLKENVYGVTYFKDNVEHENIKEHSINKIDVKNNILNIEYKPFINSKKNTNKENVPKTRLEAFLCDKEFIKIPKNSNKTLAFQTIIPFGKYKGVTFISMLNVDKNYAKWLVTNWRGNISFEVKSSVREK